MTLCANCGAPIILVGTVWMHASDVPYTDCLDTRGPIGNRIARYVRKDGAA